MYRKTANTDRITLEFIDAKFDRNEAKWERERRESDEKWERERKESNEKWERDRKESNEWWAAFMERMDARYERDRKESEARLEREFRESRSTRRWMIATFFTVVIGLGGLIYTLSNNGYLPFMGGI